MPKRPFSQFLREYEERSLLRFTTVGSVDDGKSTLIGRLLHDSNHLRLDQLATLTADSRRQGSVRSVGSVGAGDDGTLDFALLTDGLKAEREQGITIDVAYRYFSTPKRNFIIADTPGHVQYTRNMATGASTAHLAIILIDARKGLLTQTKRHAFIASLLGIPRLLVAVNKMDLVDDSQEVFESIREDFSRFAVRLGIVDLKFIPISALRGDNVVHPSERLAWYHGETILEHLETVYVGSDRNLIDFRFPVQLAVRPNPDFRGFAGQVASGRIRVGEEVMVLPSRRRSRIERIIAFDGDLEEAYPSQSVTLTLTDELDIARGDVLVRPNNLPHIERRFEAMLIWLDEAPLDPSRVYVVQHGTRSVKAAIEQVRYRVNVDTLSREEAQPLEMNEIGRVEFEAHQPLFFDAYRLNRQTGGFILVDRHSHRTVAAGLFIHRLSASELEFESTSTERAADPAAVTRDERLARTGAAPRTIWLTGLSGSGKSTIARALERALFDLGRAVYSLDGDVLRTGLNADLGFSPEDRAENVRRVAAVAQLMNDAGTTVITSLISPFDKERQAARTAIGEGRFLEIAVTTPLEECEKRDPKGLYRKARAGEIPEFTGVSSPYEPPRNPDLELDTSTLTVDECVERILALLSSRGA